MKRWPIKPKHIVFAFGIILLAILIMDFNKRLEELNRLTVRAESVNARATAVVNTQMALQTRVAYATSDEAVEEWAREDRHWIQPGETLVVVIPLEGSTPTPTPNPPPQTPQLSNWEIWWELFFGD